MRQTTIWTCRTRLRRINGNQRSDVIGVFIGNHRGQRRVCEQFNDRGNVEPSFGGTSVCEVGDPLLVWRRPLEARLRSLTAGLLVLNFSWRSDAKPGFRTWREDISARQKLFAVSGRGRFCGPFRLFRHSTALLNYTWQRLGLAKYQIILTMTGAPRHVASEARPAANGHTEGRVHPELHAQLLSDPVGLLLIDWPSLSPKQDLHPPVGEAHAGLTDLMLWTAPASRSCAIILPQSKSKVYSDVIDHNDWSRSCQACLPDHASRLE
jgi:hypothetical protein